MQKTVDSLEDLESRLEGWLTNIERKIVEINNRAEVTSAPNGSLPDVLSKLSGMESNLMEEVARFKEGLHNNVAKVNRESAMLMEKTHTVFSEVIHL